MRESGFGRAGGDPSRAGEEGHLVAVLDVKLHDGGRVVQLADVLGLGLEVDAPAERLEARAPEGVLDALVVDLLLLRLPELEEAVLLPVRQLELGSAK